MRLHSRRQLLQGSLALAGIGILSGCEMPGQPATKARRIGFLAVGSREGRAFMIDGFLQGLRERGYVEGQNIVIEYRFSDDRNDRLPELAAELVGLKVEVILASGTPARARRMLSLMNSPSFSGAMPLSTFGSNTSRK